MKEINDINSVIETFFKNNPALSIIPVKVLMPDFIAAGIFKKDIKNGKPIRDVLKALLRTEQLQQIPCAHAQEKDGSIYWYFIPKNAPKPTSLYKQEAVVTKKEEAIKLRLQSDESYVIDLCDTALDLKAERQKRFDFLLGDLHKDGVTRTKLPVGAYYESKNLVVEYKESQLKFADNFIDKPKTISGVSRYEQRQRYDERRAIELPNHGIQLITIKYDVFNVDDHYKIIRNPEQDLKTVQDILTNEIIDTEDIVVS